MHSFVTVESFRALIHKYDTYFFDLWGTVYDGYSVFPNFLSVLSLLYQESKTVRFLSNSPRRSSVSKSRLEQCGLNVDLGAIITSGEYFEHLLLTSEYGKQKFFLIGDDPTVLEGFSINVVNSISDADYVLIALCDQTMDLGRWRGVMQEAVAKGIPGVCVNPDIEVFQGKTKFYTPGYYAMQYEKMGGEVVFFGKPYKPVYDFILSKIGSSSNVLAVGDAVATDIRGAYGAGIDSLLILGDGIHNGIKVNDKMKILSLCQQYKCCPNYIMDKLMLDQDNL